MRILIAPLLLALAACQSAVPMMANDAGHAAPVVSDTARKKALSEADWKRMESVSLQLRDYGLTPREIRLKAGQPYRLTISNTGSVSHYFNAPEFLRSVATRKAQVPDQAEFKADFFTSFEIARRGGSMELYFIPLVRGTYTAHCHLDGKKHEDVRGTLIVE